jgi:hypothetical protein
MHTTILANLSEIIIYRNDLKGTSILKLSEMGSEARMRKDKTDKWKGYYDFG